MTEFLHEKYKEFIRYKYGIQSGGFACSNIEELMCGFATEVAKEYIEMASKLENENKELKKQIIEWHDPNDFPKRNGNVVQNQDGDKVTYDYMLKQWRWTDGGTDGLEMIAWCEIPQFKEKMTKEELQKANSNEILEELYYCGRDPYYADYYENVTIEIKNRLERSADLEKQIEKMKCCNNCKYRCYMDWKSKCCFDMTEIRDIENPITCKCNKWELENE